MVSSFSLFIIAIIVHFYLKHLSKKHKGDIHIRNIEKMDTRDLRMWWWYEWGQTDMEGWNHWWPWRSGGEFWTDHCSPRSNQKAKQQLHLYFCLFTVASFISSWLLAPVSSMQRWLKACSTWEHWTLRSSVVSSSTRSTSILSHTQKTDSVIENPLFVFDCITSDLRSLVDCSSWNALLMLSCVNFVQRPQSLILKEITV